MILSRYNDENMKELKDEEITENIYIVISGNKSTRTDGQPPYCNVCEKDFKSSIKYAKHSIKHSLDGIFSCHICHITAKMTLDQIETHIRIHENKPKYTCQYCQAKLFSKYSAIEHEICHSGIKGSSTVFCELCSKGFMFLCSLQAHVKKSHPDCVLKINKTINKKETLPEEHLPVPIFPSSSIFCYICKNTYKDNINYALHSVQHNENRKFNCYLCALQSKMSDSEIVDHIKMHLNATVHRCSVCDKGFSRKIDAVEHVYFHKSYKPYECKLCNTNFMFSRCLLSHRKNHHNLTNKWVRGCTACDFHQL
ncbi:zinc finger protein 271-like [Diorhabda sublineata]|uniref:zinc finger protein 271-like n=1 Tax=Diorhabda sublineata TaxID=1163346 RepID=UPI0024E180AA|nr:zinc finger protein 271-like [Diorhabda sublineata]